MEITALGELCLAWINALSAGEPDAQIEAL